MHKLLERQVQRLYGDHPPDGLLPLLEAVSSAYTENDADRLLLERSLELTSQELLARNQELRERSEEALAASAATLREAQALAHLGSWTLDPATGAMSWSEEMFRLLGMAPGNAEAQRATWLDQVHPADARPRRDAVERGLAAGEPYHVEYRIILADGQERWLAEKGRLEPAVAGHAASIVGTCQDITETRRKDEAVHAALGASEQANRAKTEFLANMSHEIRTPLNAIIGLADLLEGPNLTGEQADHVSTIRGSGEHLLGILNQVLDFSKLQAGRLELDVAPVDLRALATQCLDTVRPAAQKKTLDVRLQMEPDIPAQVWGDGGRLRQVLLNLLSNAVKFTPAGAVTLHIANRPAPEGRREVELAVEDSGIGIPAERFDRLFLPFSQIDSSITRSYGGTGLGLALAKRLVEAMDGRITVESELGKGTTFRVRLPMQAIDVKGGVVGPAAASPSAHGLRVLLAEDNLVNQKVAMSMLKALHCEADVVGDGEQAVAALARTFYDIVLLDVQMPVLDGLEAARRIRRQQRPDRPRPYLIALTAHAQPGDREACLAAGMDDYLAKPVRLAALGATLSRQLH